MSGLHSQRTGSPIGSIDRTCHPRDDSNDKQRLICLFLNNLPHSLTYGFSLNYIAITQALSIPNDWFQAGSYNLHSLDSLSFGMLTIVTRTLDHNSNGTGQYKYLVEAQLTVSDQYGDEIDKVRLGAASHGPGENQTVGQVLRALRRRAKVYYNWYGECRTQGEQDTVDWELRHDFD
jgi:hypothetical protein